MIKVTLMMMWVISTVVSTILMLFCKEHEDLYLKPYPKYKSPVKQVIKPSAKKFKIPNSNKSHFHQNKVIPMNIDESMPSSFRPITRVSVPRKYFDYSSAKSKLKTRKKLSGVK